MSLDVYLYAMKRTAVYDRNITHNLGEMADKAGIYKHLWRPEEIGITKAHQLIDPLRNGFNELVSKPEYYKEFNPENGWGDYKALVDFVEEYLKACEENPEADVFASR